MEDDIVVSCIKVMAVTLPVAGAQMYLDIPSPQSATDAHLGIDEVGTCIGVMQTRVYDLKRLAVGCGQRLQREQAVAPDIV